MTGGGPKSAIVIRDYEGPVGRREKLERMGGNVRKTGWRSASYVQIRVWMFVQDKQCKKFFSLGSANIFSSARGSRVRVSDWRSCFIFCRAHHLDLLMRLTARSAFASQDIGYIGYS